MDAQNDAWIAFEARDYAKAERLWICLLDEAETDEERRSHVVGYGYILVAQKRFDQARRLFQKLIEEEGGDHLFWHQLALVEREAGNLERALELIEAEAEVLSRVLAPEVRGFHAPQDPHLAWAVNAYEQGFLRLKMGRLKEAESWAERCIDLSLRTADWVAQGCAFRLMGDLCAARYHRAEISLGAVGPLYSAREAYGRALSAFQKAADLVGQREVHERLRRLATF